MKPFTVVFYAYRGKYYWKLVDTATKVIYSRAEKGLGTRELALYVVDACFDLRFVDKVFDSTWKK